MQARRLEACLKILEHLNDSNEEQITVSDLCMKVGEILEVQEPYFVRFMDKVIRTLGDRVIISICKGRQILQQSERR